MAPIAGMLFVRVVIAGLIGYGVEHAIPGTHAEGQARQHGSGLGVLAATGYAVM